jgi:hypothetical protein
MKMKLLVSLAVVAALGSNAYALQISKGRLIEHKQWSTNGVAVATTLGKKFVPKAMNLDVNGLHSSLSVKAVSQSVKVGEPVVMSNDGGIILSNDSDTAKIYTFGFSICAESDAADGTVECVHTQDRVELQPNGEVSQPDMPVLHMTFNKPGNYSVFADAMLDGWTRSYSGSSGTISVS